jgi:ribonuclease P protein component
MDSDSPRFAIVVSKAVGGAVQRNLLKRRARSAIFDLLQTRSFGISAVLRLRPSSASASYSDFSTSISELLVKASK